MDLFKDTVWNTYRIRTQKSTTDFAIGIPYLIFDFPSGYDLEKCGNNYS